MQGCGKKGTDPTPVTPVTPVPTIPNTANFDKLAAWNAYKANPGGSSYDLIMIGDSYTQGNYHTGLLRTALLADGYANGGPGYCSFGRGDTTNMALIDASITASELTFTYDPLKWGRAIGNAVGPCGNVQNTVADAAITVTATVPLQSMTIIYQRYTGAGEFQYRVNGGAWTTVSTNVDGGNLDIQSVVVDVSGAGSSIQMDIQPLAANEIFCGVLGRRTGNVFTAHKAGCAGQTADFFAQNDMWNQSTTLLAPKGAIIMFGTNEMYGNVDPAVLKANLQNIITNLKKIQPNIDIMLMCPPQTTLETEDPRKYKIEDYGAAIYSLAQADNVAFINFPTIFGPFSQASVDNGLMASDRVHPGTAGSKLIETTIYSAFKK